MKKRLLVFHPIIAPYRIDFFNELNNRFDTKICLFYRNLTSQKFDYSQIEKQLNFVPTYLEKSQGLFSWLIALVKQLCDYRPDVVLCSEFGLATLLTVIIKIFARKKYKILSIVDDSYNMVAEGNQFSWKHAWATRLLMPFMDNTINVEPRVVEYYKRNYGKGVYMPIIVDDDIARSRLQRILPISQQYVEQYNLVGKKILLFVGRLVELKNVPFALKAFLNANIKDGVFVIVGDGPERAKLEKIAKGCDNIIFTGRLEGDALYAWYNVAQVFTLPSTQEAFGAVTNEALLGGCFALVSKLAGSNCLIKNDVNGVVVDPYNSELYTKTLKELMDKCEPVKEKVCLRPNFMQISFKERIDSLKRQIENLD